MPRSVTDQLTDFLGSFSEKEGEYKYRVRLSALVAGGATSLVVDFPDLLAHDVNLANRLLSEPQRILDDFRRAAFHVLESESAPYAAAVKDELRVRIRSIPDPVPLQHINVKHLGHLISLGGIILRVSNVQALMTTGSFVCPNGHTTFQDQTDPYQQMVKPPKCELCDETRRLELDKNQSKYTDFQTVRIQELPEELPPGKMPRSYEIMIKGDLVGADKDKFFGTLRPGDRALFDGIPITLSEFTPGRTHAPIFGIYIDCNYAEVVGKSSDLADISKEDEEKIKSIAGQKDAYTQLLSSVAPAVMGHEREKEAMLLLMAGSPTVILPDRTELRGNINVLFVGDPSTAKSELAKFVALAAPRAMYGSGRGSTAAGLTAAIVREPNNTLHLEAGLVVLADLGVGVIDEFDKLRDEDRSALHEMMEQNRVSVAKGGFVATLNARTSILAVANPVLGRYNPYQNILENVNIPVPLVTRFDTIFVIRDQPDAAQDLKLAKHILKLRQTQQFAVNPPVPIDLLKKYISYCKSVNPVLTEEANSQLETFYLELRRVSSDDQIPATPRTLESLIRLATARARVLLRDKVTAEDAKVAIDLMRNMVADVLTDSSGAKSKVDFGRMYGYSAEMVSQARIALELFRSLEEFSDSKVVEIKAFKDELVKKGIDAEVAGRIINQLQREGVLYESASGFLRRAVRG